MPGFLRVNNDWKTAQKIHDRLASRNSGAQIDLPEAQWRELATLARQIHRARRRGWNACADRLSKNLSYAAQRFVSSLQRLEQQARLTDRHGSCATPAEIYRDLLALRQEFEETFFDPGPSELVVATEPIHLEGIYLGPFQIRLDVALLDTEIRYQVVALDPHPARCNQDVTHPHVDGQTLCEGEGHAAIQAAIESGRIGDFFQLISRILRTYGEGSAYVELRDWEGDPCSGCGATISDSESCTCERCKDTYCSGCIGHCQSCGEEYCHGCLKHCANCDEANCAGCRSYCRSCDSDMCPNCLVDGQCPCCHEHSRENEYEEDQTPDAAV